MGIEYQLSAKEYKQEHEEQETCIEKRTRTNKCNEYILWWQNFQHIVALTVFIVNTVKLERAEPNHRDETRAAASSNAES